MTSVCLIEYYDWNAEIVSLCNGTYKALGSLLYTTIVSRILYDVPILF